MLNIDEIQNGIVIDHITAGTAIGLMNSVINIIILVSVNKAFSRLTENSLW